MATTANTGIEEIKVLPDRDYGNTDEIWIQLRSGVTVGISIKAGMISDISIAAKDCKREGEE